MNEFYSISAVIKMVGIPRYHIDSLIHEGRINPVDGKITGKDVFKMMSEKKEYISLLGLATSYSSERFKGEKYNDREKLLDYLEENEFFGVEIIEPENLLTASRRDGFYIRRKDIQIIDTNISRYLNDFGRTPFEKLKKSLKTVSYNTVTMKYLNEYREDYLAEKEITDSVCDFIRVLSGMPDVTVLTDEDIKKAINKPSYERSKDLLISFLNYVHTRRSVKYSYIRRSRKETVSVTAYSDETYLRLAHCFFNSEYIAENKMIEKALNYHIFAEMWLYLTLFFTCGWRAGDICRGWKYLRIQERDSAPFNLNPDTLYEDILFDRIPDETYEQVCMYAIGCISVSGMVPSKTSSHNPSHLMAVITEELYPFYGLLTLVAESHQVRSGDGYMKQKRQSTYQNRMTLREFFGDEIREILHDQNIYSRRLNKVFLQGIEENARKTGCGSLLASAVASFARNHTSLETIRSYLKDHSFRGEDAGTVLYFMLQRGVFGFEYYQLLLTAYPDAMKELTLEEQNRVIAKIKESPLEIELIQSSNKTSYDIEKAFRRGESDKVLQMLICMFEISQTRGKAKDEGCYCTLRALHMACEHPEYHSCIANGCRHTVLTRYGLRPSAQILLNYQDKAYAGDKKAEAVLKKILFPRYRLILNALMRDTGMTPEERKGIKLIIEEEQHSYGRHSPQSSD